MKRIIKYISSYLKLGLRYSKNSNFILLGYSDSDFVGCKIDRKSTTRTCQLMGCMLVSWFPKKQNWVALSTTEAEYVALGSYCVQLSWMQQQSGGFGEKCSSTPIMCHNTSAINLPKNPIIHSRAKYIEIRLKFVRDQVNNGDISIHFVDSKHQLVNIFTKTLEKRAFEFVKNELGINNPLSLFMQSSKQLLTFSRYLLLSTLLLGTIVIKYTKQYLKKFLLHCIYLPLWLIFTLRLIAWVTSD